MDATKAIACALIALIDRLDMLVDTLISLGAQGKSNCVHGLPADCCALCIPARRQGDESHEMEARDETVVVASSRTTAKG